MPRWMRHCLVATLLLTSLPAMAGQLIIHNISPATITCTADGYTTATGWPYDWQIQVNSGEKFYLAQNYNRPQPVINWVQCGSLRTRMMNITPDSLDGLVMVNGQQNRVLNAALYPYLPSNPNGNFQALLTHVISTYQAQYPEVLLNVVMNQNINIYSYSELPQLLGPAGFDVMELDTLYIGFLAQNRLITPATISGDPPWPVGIAAASYQGTLYGVPSWLCMDFLFSFDPTIEKLTTLSQLLAYMGQMPSSRTALVGDYDGSWRLPAIYINAYVQAYGYARINQALQMPPDPAVINNLAALAETCRFQGGNHCIDGTYHSGADGTTERIFATGNASNDLGFSEQSFFIQLYQSVPGTLATTPGIWGQTPQPLLFADAFVSNSSTCAANPCATDSRNLSALMTGVAMKYYIAFSADLPTGTPPRHLLVATQPFWQISPVRNDPLYQRFRTVFATAQAFPNFLDAVQQTTIGQQVCKALQAKLPDYACQPPSRMLRREYRR